MSRTQRLKQPEQFGKYQLIARLSQGRLGQVYKAKSIGVEGFERILVIKTIDQSYASIPGFVDTIAEEAQRAVMLSHANVVQVLNLGQEETTQQPFLALEFVHGMDLRRALEVTRILEQPWPLELAIYIIAEIANGLDYAHRRKDYEFNKLNIIHHDISPFNIMLSSDGEAKLTDFGIARALYLAPITSDAEQIRRVEYQAPEAVRGESYTQRCDLFSLGLVFYELLAGFHPYHHQASSTPQLVELARQGAVPPLPNRNSLPRPIVQVLESMLVPDPNGRIGSAGQIYEELVGFIYGNNLQRADARALSLHIQNLRNQEIELFPDQDDLEAGMDEISLSELNVPDSLNSFYGDLHPESEAVEEFNSEATSDVLPRHKLQQVFMASAPSPDAPPQTPSSPLPRKIEEILTKTRSGQGKAVLLHGQMGSGKDYIPDRLAEILGAQPNTMVCAIQCLRDDKFRPFGTLADLLLSTLLPQLPEEQRDTEHALALLERLQISARAINTLKDIWEVESSDTLLGLESTRKLLAETSGAVIRDLCQRHTLIFIIDHIEFIDPLSLLVLKDIISHIGKFPSMLIMSTAMLESMRRSLDTGNPQHLEQVRIVGGQEHPRHQALQHLSNDAEHTLMLLVVAHFAMSQADLLHLTRWPNDRLFAAIKELVELGLIRGPQPGIFLATHDELSSWASQPERAAQRQLAANTLIERADRIEPPPETLSMLRIQASAGKRKAFVSGAHALAARLAQRGWLLNAMSLYKHFSEIMLEAQLHAPQSRLSFMLARAELAMELALPDECLASIGPIQALAESLHHERSILASQLLQGRLAMTQDDIEEARHHFSRALEAAHAIQDPDLLANAMTHMAKWYERYGDVANGQRMIEGALNLNARWGTQRMNLPARAKLLNLAVNMWCYRRMPRHAQQFVEDFERLAHHTQLAQLNCRLEWAKGRLQGASDDLEGSIHTLKRAASIASYHSLTALELEILRHLTHAMLLAKQFQQAIPLLERLVQLSSKHKDLYTNLRALELRALAHVCTGQHVEGALNQLETNLTLATQRRVPRDIFRCHSFLQQAYAALGKHDLAAQHAEHAGRAAFSMRYARHAA